MAIGGENGESCEHRWVRIDKDHENQQLRTSIVGPGHCGMLVVVQQGSLTRPIAVGMPRAYVSHLSTLNRISDGMSSLRGSCDEVEFLYSKPAYVSWVSSNIHLAIVETGLAVNRFSASAAERILPG